MRCSDPGRRGVATKEKRMVRVFLYARSVSLLQFGESRGLEKRVQERTVLIQAVPSVYSALHADILIFSAK